MTEFHNGIHCERLTYLEEKNGSKWWLMVWPFFFRCLWPQPGWQWSREKPFLEGSHGEFTIEVPSHYVIGLFSLSAWCSLESPASRTSVKNCLNQFGLWARPWGISPCHRPIWGGETTPGSAIPWVWISASRRVEEASLVSTRYACVFSLFCS